MAVRGRNGACRGLCRKLYRKLCIRTVGEEGVKVNGLGGESQGVVRLQPVPFRNGLRWSSGRRLTGGGGITCGGDMTVGLCITGLGVMTVGAAGEVDGARAPGDGCRGLAA